MNKKLVIDRCRACPRRRGIHCTSVEYRAIPEIDDIPEWCPLDNAQAKKAEGSIVVKATKLERGVREEVSIEVASTAKGCDLVIEGYYASMLLELNESQIKALTDAIAGREKTINVKN